jgi:cephalosporin-C deacetylase
MPLTFDFPLDQLQTYQGINPKPDNFDSYWDQALAEMRAIDPQAELVTAEFQSPVADCFHLYFTGMGGARVHAKVLKPKSSGPHPAILMFHGYWGSSGSWAEKLHFAASGYLVAAFDCRGQGGLSEDVGGVQGWTLNGHIVRGLTDALNGKPEKLLYRSNFLDTAQLAQVVMAMPDVDADRIAAMGYSQGGALTVACAALEPGIKQAVAGFPFLSDYLRVWQMDQAKDAYKELSDWFRSFDARHTHEEAVFTQLGYIDTQFLANRIQAKVLWLTGLNDTICPPSSQFATYNKVTSPKEMLIYPDFGHEVPAEFREKEYEFLLGV